MLRAHSIIAVQGSNPVGRGPRAGAWALHSVPEVQEQTLLPCREEGVGCWDVTLSCGALVTQNGAVCLLADFPPLM